MTVSSRAVVFVCLVFTAACGSVQSDLCDNVTCGANATCDMDTGTCGCNDGFSGDGQTCTDVDECAAGNPCDTNAMCANTSGSFTCTCNPGYDGDGTTCADVDECTDGSATCDPNASCTNNTGSYDCACNDGYYGDGTTCFEAVGQAVLIGHDLYERNTDVDKIVGNSVLLANTLDTIEVVGYDQYADLAADGEPVNTDAAIQDVVTAAGRTVNITRNSDYTTLPTALAGKNVLVIYEQEAGLDYATVGTALDLTLHTFIHNGGIVIGLDYAGTTSQLMDTTNVIKNVGVTSFFSGGEAMSVAVTADPIVAGVSATYSATNGTSGYGSNDGVPVVVDNVGNPVVIHKTFDHPRFDGTFGTAWEALAGNPDTTPSLPSYTPIQIGIYSMYGAGTNGRHYNEATNAWDPLPNAMPVNSYWFQLAAVGRNLYGFAPYAANIHKFSAVTNAWTTPTTYTGTSEYSTAVADDSGKIYGYLSNGQIVVYNPYSNAVSYLTTAIPALRGNGSLYETRLAYDPGTKSLYMGGYGTPELYRYDLSTGATTQLTSIPENQLNDMFCGDRAGHIYAAGDSVGVTFWQYTIATDSWVQLPDLPFDHGNSGTCTVSEAGYLYAGSGDIANFARIPLN